VIFVPAFISRICQFRWVSGGFDRCKWPKMKWTVFRGTEEIADRLISWFEAVSKASQAFAFFSARLFELVRFAKTALTFVLIDLRSSDWCHFVDYKISFHMVLTTRWSMKNYGLQRKIPLFVGPGDIIFYNSYISMTISSFSILPLPMLFSVWLAPQGLKSWEGEQKD